MTGFSCWPGYLGVTSGGVCLDLVDHHRLFAYLSNCTANQQAYRVRCQACPELGFTEGGIPRVIGCPDTDPAPWYNPSDPPYLLDVASRFYGPEIIEWNPLPVGYSGDSSERVSHRPRRGKLRIEARVRLWGDGCDATLYGLEWFQRTLECQTCNGVGLTTLRSCDNTFDPNNPTTTGGNWWRQIVAARILVEPDPETEREGSCCYFRDADIIIEADDPCSYWVTPSVECVLSAPWRGPGDEDLFPGECRCGPLCPCPEGTPLCEGDCSPSVTDPRSLLPPIEIGCYCVPFSSCRKVCEIPASSTPGLSDAVIGLTVSSPSAETRNLRVWLWKADAYDGPDVNWDQWRCRVPCTSIDVGTLRAGDLLNIDGRTRTATVTRQTETCAFEITSMGSPLAWPTLNCADAFWIGVEYDTYATDPELVVTTSVYPRECWTA